MPGTVLWERIQRLIKPGGNQAKGFFMPGSYFLLIESNNNYFVKSLLTLK